MMFSKQAECSSSSSSVSQLDGAAKGRKGVQSSSTSMTSTEWVTPAKETTTSSFNFFMDFVRMHNFPEDVSKLFQKEGTSTRTFPKTPATAAKFASSHAKNGSPTIFNQAIRPRLERTFPITSTQINHFSQMLLFALNTSAALAVLNLTATCIPPTNLDSTISYPSRDIRDGKLHNTSKFRTSPTNTHLSSHSCTSFTQSNLTACGGFCAGAETPLATSAKELVPLIAGLNTGLIGAGTRLGADFAGRGCLAQLARSFFPRISISFSPAIMASTFSASIILAYLTNAKKKSQKCPSARRRKHRPVPLVWRMASKAPPFESLLGVTERVHLKIGILMWDDDEARDKISEQSVEKRRRYEISRLGIRTLHTPRVDLGMGSAQGRVDQKFSL
ncbi:hypothetical protein LXL04_025171 [Taraxacum kok-saghyz]